MRRQAWLLGVLLLAELAVALPRLLWRTGAHAAPIHTHFKRSQYRDDTPSAPPSFHGAVLPRDVDRLPVI